MYFFLKIELWFPIWVVFLLDKNLTFSQVIIADIIFRIAITLLEFPLGSLGDKIGRKKTYFMGAFFMALALIAMVFINNFYLLLLSWILWAVGLSLISGTDTAFIYETIIYTGNKEKEMHIFGYFTGIQNIAFVISHFLASYLFLINSGLPILINGICALVAGIIILFLPNPTPQANLIPNFKEIFATTRNTMKKRPVRHLVLIQAILMMYHWTVTLIFQTFLVEIGIEIEFFGLVYISFTLLGILGGFTAGKLVDHFGEKLLVLIGIIFVVISIGLIWLLPGLWAIIGIVILSFFYYLTDTIIKVELNRKLEPQHRSSIFSFANLISSVLLALSRPFVGYISNAYTSRIGFFSWFLIGIPVLAILLVLYLKITHNKENKNQAANVSNV